MSQTITVGIDVAKDHLDICLLPAGTIWQIEQTEPAIAALVEQLGAQAPECILLEASGGYERAVMLALAAATLPVHRINPLQVRNFAKAIGRSAKTDRIDAEVLARFAQAVAPDMRPIPDAEQQELAALVDRRRQLVDLRVAERNRLRQALPSVQTSLQAHLAWLDAAVTEVEAEIDARIAAQPEWQARRRLIESVPGVGAVLGATLVAELPELGQLEPGEIAALVGVAPFNVDSGQERGQRHIWGGRKRVRNQLYMSARSAKRWNPLIRPFYERLRSQGKLEKVAVVACMRKLLVILNAMVRDGTFFAVPEPLSP